MDVLECIKTRRSNRKFTDKAVEAEKIESIIEAGRFAPSGGNNQTAHFFVITNNKVLDDLKIAVTEEFAKMEIRDEMYKSLVSSITRAKTGSYIFTYDAPVLIVVANKKNYGNAMADSACALENMMLAANALDLGSCWINQLHWLDENKRINEYLKSLGLADDETVCGAVAIGYSEPFIRASTPRHGNPVTYIS